MLTQALLSGPWAPMNFRAPICEVGLIMSTLESVGRLQSMLAEALVLVVLHNWRPWP